VKQRLFTLLVLFTLFPLCSQAKEKFEFERPKKVFMLNSFHQTHKWMQEEAKGYSSYLYRPDYELDIEYLNANNTAETPERNEIFFKLLDELYGKKEYDLIILTSQPAYKFVAENYEKISFMHDKKILCAGIEIDKTLPQIPNMLFIPLQFSVQENIRQMLECEPNATDIFIVNDYTHSGIAAKMAIQEQIKKISALKDKKIKLHYNRATNISDLTQEIRQLPPTTMLLIGIYAQESQNYYLSPEEFITIISEASSCPIFCMIDIYMQEEVVGGKMAEGSMLGHIIGKVAQSLLNNEEPPYELVYQNQSKWQFSYLQIADHDWFDLLPSDSNLKYKPLGFFEKYRPWFITIFVLLLLVFIAFLIVIYFNRLLRSQLAKKSQALQQYVAKFKQFVSNMPIAYIELDTSYMIRDWNHTAEKMFEYDFKNVNNTHLDNVIHLQNGEVTISTIIKNMINENRSYFIIDVDKKDETSMVSEWFLTIVKKEDGYPICMCMVVDITKETTLKNELEYMLNTSKSILLSNDRFIASSMHDLKNLMTPIIAYAELLSLEASTPKMQNIVAKLNKSANSVVQMFIEMMNLSRIRSGLTHIDKQPLDLSKLVCIVIAMLEINFKQKNIKIKNTITENVQVFADQEMLNSILLNLLGNACKFTYPNGNIIISSHQQDENYVAVSIANDGLPADIEKLERLISERKYFSTQGTSGEEGSGLGLLLCTDLVSKNGGTLSVAHYTNDSGACFTFTVPIAQ